MKVNDKLVELRKLTNEELATKITTNKKELLDLRFKQATGALDKPHLVRELKKDVARMNTILKERELEVGGNN